MTLIKWTPIHSDLYDLDNALDTLSNTPGFNPAIDLYESHNNLIAEISLAGIDPKDVKLHIEDNILNIEGTAEKKTEIDDKNYYRKEVRAGAFHRMITLPAVVNTDAVKADYAKGILTVTMPKKDIVKPKSVEIKIKN